MRVSVHCKKKFIEFMFEVFMGFLINTAYTQYQNTHTQTHAKIDEKHLASSMVRFTKVIVKFVGYFLLFIYLHSIHLYLLRKCVL